MERTKRLVRLWRGYHSPSIFDLLEKSWERQEAIIFCPPQLEEGSFATLLKNYEHEFVGDWQDLIGVKLRRAIEFHRNVSSRSVDAEKVVELDPLLGLFTTGTTSGKPRLIFYSRENILASLESIRSVFELSRIENIFRYPQPFHIFGMVLGYLQSLIFRTGFSMIEGRYTRKFHEDWIQRSRLSKTLTLGTPTHFYDLIQLVTKEGRVPYSTYSSIIGGAKVDRHLWLDSKKILRIEQPSIGYGCSEASPGIAHLGPGIEPHEDGEIGSLLPGVTVTDLTDESFAFDGLNRCVGFFQEDRFFSHEKIFVRDRIFETKPGRWVFRGRSDFVVNRGGEKISIEDVVSKLESRFPYRFGALAVRDPRLGEDLSLLLEWKNEDPLPESIKRDIFSFLQATMARQFDVTKFQTLPQLPITPNGKIDLFRLKHDFQKTTEKSLPIPTSELIDYIPHRAPMIWVDWVEAYSEDSGTCSLDIDLHPMCKDPQGNIKPSSIIEWVAQSCAFLHAARAKFKSTEGGAGTLKRAYLVGIKSLEFRDHRELTQQTKFFVTIKPQAILGPLAVVLGTVTDGSEKVIATGSFKLFADTGETTIDT